MCPCSAGVWGRGGEIAGWVRAGLLVVRPHEVVQEGDVPRISRAVVTLGVRLGLLPPRPAPAFQPIDLGGRRKPFNLAPAWNEAWPGFLTRSACKSRDTPRVGWKAFQGILGIIGDDPVAIFYLRTSQRHGTCNLQHCRTCCGVLV